MRKFVFILFLIGLCAGAQGQYASRSVLAEGNWYRIAIAETGMYRIDTENLPGLRGCSISHIALFGQRGGKLSEDNRDSRPDDLLPCPIRVFDQNSNGLFDDNDYLIFYAEGAAIWQYNDDIQRFTFLQNPYATKNYYFLRTDATSSLSVPMQDPAYPNSADITQYFARATIHNELTNTHCSGQTWVGEKFNNATTTRNFSLNIPNAIPGSTLYARYALASISSASASFAFTLNGANRSHYFGVSESYKTFLEQYTPNSGNLNIGIIYNYLDNRANGYLDYIEVNMLANLSFTGGQMDFRNMPVSTGSASTFRLTNASSNVRVWDVTSPTAPIEMSTELANGTLSWVAPTQDLHEYIAFDGTSWRQPSEVRHIDNQDIHGAPTPNMVIVCNPAFKTQAQEIADLHQQYDNLQVLVLTDQEVYNEFSSGRQDAMALRQMMRMFWNRDESHKSRYLMLMGGGTYDNRNILGKNQNAIVTYESTASFDTEGSSYASDDALGYMHDNEVGLLTESLDLSIGRLPVSTTEEADLLVDKLANYMGRADLLDPSSRGDWRNYIALLADDADPSCPGDTVFATSSEATAKRITQNYPQYNIDKIYADAYSQQSGADGSYYPDVNNALKKRIDYGCLLLNYIGHGSTQYIGTERYMQLADIDAYNNTDRLPFFVTSTCSFGKYDRPDTISGAEAFLLAPAAGVAVVSASRPIGHIQRFNTDVCLNAINPDNRIGDALRMAKNATPTSHSIILLGDPALRLAFPRYQVIVTSINGKHIESGICDTATTLSRVTIEGEIQDAQGNLQSNFNGEIFPIVFDRENMTHTLANDNEDTEVEFSQQKNMLYKGRETVTDGRFSYSFIVPRDVPFAYGHGKLSHYAKSGTADATGAYTDIVFGGFDESSPIPECHPIVQLFLNDSTFRSGGITDENPTLFAILQDSVGINMAGSGLGHDITALMDGKFNEIIVLNDFYEPDIENSQRGYISYKLTNLSEGYHTLSLKAWNIFNFSGSDTISFYVKSSAEPQTGAFYAYPNPASQQVTLHLEHNAKVTSAQIDIYNIQGQRVRTLTPATENDSYTLGPVRWNFQDVHGEPLPRGLYIARATLQTENTTLNAITKILKQ